MYRVPKSGAWTAESRFTVSDDSTVAAFGRTIVVSGLDVFVSAPLGVKAVGSVFVFSRSANGEYTQTARLLPSEQAEFSIFGRGIAVSGDQLIIGAPGANHSIGAVYVFKRTGNGWVQSQLLTVPGGGPGVRFGHLVRAEGNVMVAAGPQRRVLRGTGVQLRARCVRRVEVHRDHQRQGDRHRRGDGRRGEVQRREGGRVLLLVGGPAVVHSHRVRSAPSAGSC